MITIFICDTMNESKNLEVTSLTITLFFSTLAGAIVPLIMAKLNIDPAIASGPFITTINDIIGLTIYFTVATAFMEYLV